jgi:hypothetical protein
VVEAALAQIQLVHDKDDAGGILVHLYTMHTDRRLRGEIGQDFTVYESNDSRRATFDWDVGQHYLLFLISSATSDKSWSLDNCGNLGQLNWAQTVSAQIQKTGEVDHKYGAISRIVGHDALSNPIPGVLVEGSATNRHLLHHDERPGSI